MHPEDFMAYWGISIAELSLLLSKSKETIYHWLGSETAKSKREPPGDVLRQLQMIHALWMQWDSLHEHLPEHIRTIYEQVRDRRQLERSASEPDDEDN